MKNCSENYNDIADQACLYEFYNSAYASFEMITVFLNQPDFTSDNYKGSS